MAKTYKKVALTTVDNPYDPFEDFQSWYDFDDFLMDYGTCAKIARQSPKLDNSHSLTDEEIQSDYERVLDDIIKENPSIAYYKVYKEVPMEPEEDR